MAIPVSIATLATLNNQSILTQSNSNFSNIQTALQDAVSRSGSSPNQMQSPLDMNSNNILNLPPASLPTEPVILSQVTGTSLPIGFPTLTGDVTGTVNTSTGTVPTTISAGVVTGTKIATNTVANSNLVQIPSNTVMGNPTGSTGNVQDVTPLTARSSSLLNIEQTTFVGDANYQILPTDRMLAATTPFTAARTFTLPAANSVNNGARLSMWIWGLTSTNTLTVQRTGTDQINVPYNATNNVTSIVSPPFSNIVFWEFISIGATWILVNSNYFTASLGGAAPPSGGGTSNFLRADGSWVSPTASGSLVAVNFYTTTQTITIPSATKALVRLVGGGGGGGGATCAATNEFAFPGNGGGGGGLVKFLTGLTAGNTFALTIGTAGTGGAAGANNGVAGGSTILASGTQTITTLTAGGGGLGASATGNASNTVYGAQGAGGTSTNGDANITGSPGFSGGQSAFGFGGPGNFTNSATSANGVNGVGFGGGGLGGSISGVVANVSGGSGTAGICQIEWYS